MSSLHRGFRLGILVGLLFSCSTGCGQDMQRSFHEKFNWKAEDYFEDKKVIALCRAIEANDLVEMERLIKDGADVKAIGKGKMTPLLWAFPDNKPERFKLLLEYGADPNIFIESDFNTKNKAFRPGDSVTQMSTKSIFPEHFGLVLQHGGDVNLVNPKSHESVLTTAIRQGRTFTMDRVKMLIERGADVNNMSSGTPPVIDAASWFGQYELARVLVEAGANPDLCVEDRVMTLVHILVGEKQLLEKNGTPEKRAKLEQLMRLLKERGESFEDAEADLKRWNSWSAKPAEEIARLMDAEVVARKAREAAEKAKKEEASKEKKP